MAVVAYVNLTAAEDVATAALGDEYDAPHGARYKYVQASAAVDAFSLCRITATNTIAESTATDLTTTRPALVCIPQFAVANGQYAWAPVGPFTLREDNVTTFKVLSKIANASVVLYGTATAGSVDDAVSNPSIAGLTLTAACAVDDTATACVAASRMTVNS